MSADPLPWSVPVRIDELGRGLHRRLSADEPTRARIAKALDLEALERLDALVEVKPVFEGGRIGGRFSARVTQICGVTLEPFDSEIEGELEAAFTTREPEPPAPGEELGLGDLDTPDYVPGAEIDLGQYVVEHLALEIDPFPRKPGAVFEPPAEEAEPSPFAVLAKLRPDDPSS
jgi:uncharacterized metal-binding protein YceD (DUF177 family)